MQNKFKLGDKVRSIYLYNKFNAEIVSIFSPEYMLRTLRNPKDFLQWKHDYGDQILEQCIYTIRFTDGPQRTISLEHFKKTNGYIKDDFMEAMYERFVAAAEFVYAPEADLALITEEEPAND